MKNSKVIIKETKLWTRFVFLTFIIITLVFFLISINPAEQSVEGIKLIGKHKPNCTCPTDNNLPIIIIDTNNQEIKSDNEYVKVIVNGAEREVMKKSLKYKNVSLKLYEPHDYGYTSICGVVEPTLQTDVTINTRGQSSLSSPKKQYTIAFKNEDGTENALEILGMPKHDKWVLNGSYEDKSLIRNHLAYKMAGQVMEYAPRTRYVEVYLNDMGDKEISFEKHYIGVYLLTEKIERDVNRVDIDRNQDKYKDISFIIARDKIKEGDSVLGTKWGSMEDDLIIDEYGRIRPRTVITTSYPGPSILNLNYEEDILNFLNRFEYTLRSSEFNDMKIGYKSFIDVDSFVNFAMINDIFKNIDGGDVSTYFYKDIGGLMKAGPVWDFDLTLGNTSVNQVNEPTGFSMINTIWFERLFQDKYFADRYSKILYPYYRSKKWETIKIYNMVDDAVKELGPASTRNSKRWYEDYGEVEYKQEINNIKGFLGKRLNWMDENIHIVKRLIQNAIE